MIYAIKAKITDPRAKAWTFKDQKTMYGGKNISAGDIVFLFASENEGGQGLVARGRVTAVEATPKNPELERQTPRVSIEVERVKHAKKPLGRVELKPFNDWDDGKPETEWVGV